MFERGDAPALDPALLKEWEGLAGVDHHLGVAQRTSRAALDAVGPVDAETLQKGFDALPATASFPSADDAAVQTFASTEEGAELVRDWGRQAARNVGVVRGRMGLMLKSMTPEDRSKAEAWFDELPPFLLRFLTKRTPCLPKRTSR